MTRLLAIAAAAALLGVGCAGDDGPAPAASADSPLPRLRAAPAAGKQLERFVAAAARSDTAAMFRMLSERARVLYGPTEADFSAQVGRELMTTLRSFTIGGGRASLALAARATDEWAVAAISGYAILAGEKQHGAYAVPLRREDGEWRIELGGTVTFNPLTPDGTVPTGPTPEIATEVTPSEPILEYAAWVDRRPLGARLSPDGLLLTASVATPLAEGRHTVVTFAATESSAGANAFTFEVG
jgi:hypothetical protein